MNHETLSLVAMPGTRLTWQVGDHVTVVLMDDGPQTPTRYLVTYVDPQRISLERSDA